MVVQVNQVHEVMDKSSSQHRPASMCSSFSDSSKARKKPFDEETAEETAEENDAEIHAIAELRKTLDLSRRVFGEHHPYVGVTKAFERRGGREGR